MLFEYLNLVGVYLLRLYTSLLEANATVARVNRLTRDPRNTNSAHCYTISARGTVQGEYKQLYHGIELIGYD